MCDRAQKLAENKSRLYGGWWCGGCGDFTDINEMVKCEGCKQLFCSYCDEGGMCRDCREGS